MRHDERFQAVLAAAAVIAALTVGASGASAVFKYRFTVPGVNATGDAGGEPAPEPTGPFASCKEILDADPAAASGVHEIELHDAVFDVWCDMESAGGGWTLVAALYEDGGLIGWSSGRPVGYDPSLGGEAPSFTLTDAEIPEHSETAFGKDHEATFVDYVDFQYHTGDINDPIPGMTANINGAMLTGKKTGLTFHLNRDAARFYRFGLEIDYNGAAQLASPAYWKDALSFGVTPNTGFGSRGYDMSWIYAGNNSGRQAGVALKGTFTGTSDSFAWTIWVR